MAAKLVILTVALLAGANAQDTCVSGEISCTDEDIALLRVVAPGDIPLRLDAKKVEGLPNLGKMVHELTQGPERLRDGIAAVGGGMAAVGIAHALDGNRANTKQKQADLKSAKILEEQPQQSPELKGARGGISHHAVSESALVMARKEQRKSVDMYRKEFQARGKDQDKMSALAMAEKEQRKNVGMYRKAFQARDKVKVEDESAVAMARKAHLKSVRMYRKEFQARDKVVGDKAEAIPAPLQDKKQLRIVADMIAARKHKRQQEKESQEPFAKEVLKSCGQHSAATCAGCPQGNGAAWCHGDCMWSQEYCIDKVAGK